MGFSAHMVRKMTYKDKGSYESSPPCSLGVFFVSGHSRRWIIHEQMLINKFKQIYPQIHIEFRYAAKTHRTELRKSGCSATTLQRTLDTMQQTATHTATHCNTQMNERPPEYGCVYSYECSLCLVYTHMSARICVWHIHNWVQICVIYSHMSARIRV